MNPALSSFIFGAALTLLLQVGCMNSDSEMRDPDAPALDDSVLDYIGRQVFVRCIYGWGWDGNQEDPDAPDDFQMEVVSFWDGDVPRRGGIGRIKTEEHEFSGWWVVFDTRHVGSFDFEKKIGAYNIVIGREEPMVGPHEWPTFALNSGSAAGFAEIANTKETIQQTGRGNE